MEDPVDIAQVQKENKKSKKKDRKRKKLKKKKKLKKEEKLKKKKKLKKEEKIKKMKEENATKIVEPETKTVQIAPRMSQSSSSKKELATSESTNVEQSLPPSQPTDEPVMELTDTEQQSHGASSARHWADDKTMTNRKTGKWSKRESRVLMAEMQRVAEENGIEVEDLCGYRKQADMPNLDKIWHSICQVLPNRSMR